MDEALWHWGDQIYAIIVGFIKDPAIIDSIFLKRPERIEVLGLILLISLLVWRLMEREIRRYLKRTGTPSLSDGCDARQRE